MIARSQIIIETKRGAFKPNSFRVRAALFNLNDMKTLVEIKQAISDQLEYGETLNKDTEKSKIAKTKKSLQFLRKAETYLMTSPDAGYIKLELDKIKRRIKEEEGKGPRDFTGNLIPRYKSPSWAKKKINEYDRKNGITKMRDFRKFLHYLNS